MALEKKNVIKDWGKETLVFLKKIGTSEMIIQEESRLN